MDHNPTSNPTIGEVAQERFDRRKMLGGFFKAIPAVALMGSQTNAQEISNASVDAAISQGKANASAAVRDSRLTFSSITLSREDRITVSPGYKSEILIKWGDPVEAGAPEFNPEAMTGAAQARQFGYNNDWLDYFSLPSHETENPSHGLLVVNHEYTNPELMFRNHNRATQTKEMTDVELNAHGLSVIEVQRDRNGDWKVLPGGRYGRRITAFTPMQITGPAAGDPLMRTSADPSGTWVLGTLNNCAGGKTPWGTALSGEENFHQYFSNAGAVPAGKVRDIHTSYGLPSGAAGYPWARHYDRFDLSKEPNEPCRFGWIIEFDPYDPQSVPKKRTALGRLRHEGCTIHVASNGRVVAYMGDDERFQFAYKFVSNQPFQYFNRSANENLLDDGFLYVARFNADGSGKWLPLVFGEGPLTPANGFNSQAEVLINTRRAARLVGATPMDRPEDMEVNPVNGKVYLALTNNTSRTDTQREPSNPRSNNRYGHIIEIEEADGNHAAEDFTWEIFILCGDGKNPAHATFFAGFDPSRVATIANPDNIAFDSRGNLWIATDGQPGSINANDGVYAVPTDGVERGHVKQLLSSVPGAETASLVFNPDETALFVTIQHPGEGGRFTNNPADQTSGFPDGRGRVNRPAIVTVTKASGSPVIGS